MHVKPVTHLAVRLYGDTPNREKRPMEYPAECREIREGESADLQPGEKLMSLDDYRAYQALHRPKYDAWQEGHLKRQARRLAMKKCGRFLRSSQLRWYLLLFGIYQGAAFLLSWLGHALLGR